MPQPPLNPAPQQANELTQTATIRNAVNLKKNTIKLIPLADSPNKYSIHFVFDASTSCRSVNKRVTQPFVLVAFAEDAVSEF